MFPILQLMLIRTQSLFLFSLILFGLNLAIPLALGVIVYCISKSYEKGLKTPSSISIAYTSKVS